MAETVREQRFERLYEEHFDRVAAYLLARSDPDTAADALARTFEVVWRRIADVPAEPLPWLLGVARRVLADGRRAQRRQDALVERIAGTINEAGEDHAESLARRTQALSAIAGLTAVQREALLLIAWDGLTERQAAAVMGCSRGALALRVHRARKQLRAALAGATSEIHQGREAPSEIPRSTQVYPSPKEAI
ncbi:MAG TPA: RNA polymerase sigma factor [Solirubrobacteraceae bacterium]|nr:RNA polymerase sigma factor [Solirubrobacteraceae bacterium]